MRTNRIKELWRDGLMVAAGWCSTPDPYVAEVMTHAGFDALVLDMQHGMAIGPDRAATWLQAVGQSDVTPLVRIPWNDPAYAQWVLDAGAMGVIVPMINTVEDARRAIGACRYPPVGFRSSGPNRARFFGTDYLARANDELLCLLMMETTQGIAALDEIAALSGVDGYYLGPIDLAVSMGLPPMLDHEAPEHVAAVQRVIDVATAHDQHAGIHVSGVDESIRRFKQGFNLNPIFTDIRGLSAAAGRAVDDLREAAAG